MQKDLKLIKTFLKVSLVSLTFRVRTVFYFLEKMTVISPCWFTMKNGISVSAFLHLTTFQTKIIATFCVEQIATFKTAGLQKFSSNKHNLQLFVESTADRLL